MTHWQPRRVVLLRRNPGRCLQDYGKAGTVTTSAEGIDKETPSITLKGPEGNVATVIVMDPKNLEKVKVGDKLAITYTEAVAISVERAEK